MAFDKSSHFDQASSPASSSEGRATPLGVREAKLTGEPHSIKRVLKLLGPGLITGASDDDPSGIGTYAVAGAALGFATLWTALFTFPLMAAVQYTCAKVGLVSHRGLAGVLRRHYPRGFLYLAVAGLVVANTINAGADIGAIAAGLNLLAPIPIGAMIVPISLTIIAGLFWGSYRLITATFKWLTLSLFGYVVAAFLARPNPSEVLRATFVPTIIPTHTWIVTLVAILGTTISPYLFFWQTSQEVEEQNAAQPATLPRRWRSWRRHGVSDAELTYAAWDVNLGMLVSNLVMYFIILATGATLFKSGKNDVQSAAEAAEALRPLAGDAATLLLATALVGTGFLAVPVLTTSAAYAVSEAFGWRFGLDQEPGRAPQFYGVIAASTLVGMLLNFVGINPIGALFWSAVINGFLAPPLLLLILLVANNRTIMGDRVNSPWTNALGGAATVAMTVAAVALVLTWGG